MRVNEIFESIQGEGKYVGHPALFIRLSGCNLNCPWCDTKYHKEYHYMTVTDIVKTIRNQDNILVVWTGGEPLLQKEDIIKVMKKIIWLPYLHMIESNATIFDTEIHKLAEVTYSPKTLKDLKALIHFMNDPLVYNTSTIKIVTDLEEVNMDLVECVLDETYGIKRKTYLMPLTTFTEKDREIKQKVWKFCTEHNLKYSPRIHIEVWGNERGH